MFWAKIHTSCELVRLGQAKRDSCYPRRLQIKEGAQHNVEIVYCNCEIPLRLGGGLHALSGELVRLLLGKRDSGYPTRLQIKEGGQCNVEIVYCNCKIPLWVGNGLHAFSGELVRLMPDK